MKNNNIKFSALFLLYVISTSCYAQQKDYDMSNPIEFKETGWNKVLCMKNGNTLLFHFAPTKPLMIKVYDSTHKRIANQEYNCRILDLDVLRTSELKGLFEVNNEAVLFIEQEHLGKQCLVRLRFDSNDGKLLDETLVLASASLSKRTRFYVMQNKEDDNYAILFCTDEPQFYRCDVHVNYYNNKHETIKEIPLEVDRKNYDYIDVACAESRPNGILIALDLKKVVMNKTVSKESPQRAIYNHHAALYYIPKDSVRVNRQTIDLSTDVFPYYSHYTYNPFAKTLNLLLFSYRELYYKFGIDVRRGAISADLFFKIEEDNSDIKFNWIKNDSVTAALQLKTDTSKVFYGIPLAMFTNENGLTTLVTQGYERYDEPETRVRYNWDTYFGSIGITQLDDDGNEIWGTVLPLSEYFKSYRHYYHPKEIAKKNQTHKIFDDLPEQVADRQLVSFNSYSYKKNLYIIFNDDDRNFDGSHNSIGDTIYNFENTNACYYKMNRKREITKNYLLGEPGRNEYKCSFIEGADFDEQRGVYATLVQYKRNDETSLRMAWRHLD